MSQKSQKWSRTKAILQAWTDKLAMSKQLKVNSKEFKSDRGFLVYISRTYPAMVPYLKGFHLTLETWQSGWDKEGWKQDKNQFQALDEVYLY